MYSLSTALSPKKKKGENFDFSASLSQLLAWAVRTVALTTVQQIVWILCTFPNFLYINYVYTILTVCVGSPRIGQLIVWILCTFPNFLYVNYIYIAIAVHIPTYCPYERMAVVSHVWHASITEQVVIAVRSCVVEPEVTAVERTVNDITALRILYRHLIHEIPVQSLKLHFVGSVVEDVIEHQIRVAAEDSLPRAPAADTCDGEVVISYRIVARSGIMYAC